MDLRDCFEAIAQVQNDLRDNCLSELNLAGENWWMLLRHDFTRPFTTRRSAVYRRHFRTVSHTDPTAMAVSRRAHPAPWHARRLGQNGLASAREDLLEAAQAGARPWAHYGLFRDHNEWVDGRLFNRIADAWIDALGLHDELLKLCPFDAPAPRHAFWLDPLWLVEAPEARSSSAELEPGQTRRFLKAHDRLSTYCRERSIPFFSDRETVLHRIAGCLAQAGHWEALLALARPRFLALS
ncbi:MAG: hypothetical protein ACLFR7_13235, partial [Opitutales bacterium]